MLLRKVIFKAHNCDYCDMTHLFDKGGTLQNDPRYTHAEVVDVQVTYSCTYLFFTQVDILSTCSKINQQTTKVLVLITNEQV